MFEFARQTFSEDVMSRAQTAKRDVPCRAAARNIGRWGSYGSVHVPSCPLHRTPQRRSPAPRASPPEISGAVIPPVWRKRPLRRG